LLQVVGHVGKAIGKIRYAVSMQMHMYGMSRSASDLLLSSAEQMCHSMAFAGRGGAASTHEHQSFYPSEDEMMHKRCNACWKWCEIYFMENKA